MANESEKAPSFPKQNYYTTLLDNDKNTILHYSAARGKDEDFAKNVIGNENVNPENYLGWTPLMMACRRGRTSTVKFLLERGADATRSNKFGTSVFLISIAGGNLEIVKIIMKHLLEGGIPKRIMENILSPLSMSILFKNYDIMEYLVRQKFNPNASTRFTGITPSMFAAAMEDNQALTLLIKYNADQSVKNYLGDTADDIKKSRYHKKETEKLKPLKLTPAEMISRSPHMVPNYLYSPGQSFLNLSPAHLYIAKSPATAILITSPNLTQINTLGMPQVFFPSNFETNQFMSVTPIPVSNFFANENTNIGSSET